MARGWESKAVAEQMEQAAEAAAAGAEAGDRHPEFARKLANLQLARAQVQRALAGCQNPRYRQMLERALADLDRELAQLPQQLPA